MNIPKNELFRIVDLLQNGIEKHLIINNEEAFIENKVSNLVQTRITAEFCSALIKIQRVKKENNREIIEKLTKWIIHNQNVNGSWNEKHVNYDKPSSVFTAICAMTLLDVKESFSDVLISNEVFEKAAKFLLDQEISSGHYRKSEYYHADILNADAMVAAFLVRLGKRYENEEYIKAGKRALANICANQFADGAFPYGGSARAYPYKYHLNTTCIHYQTVTLYYLLKSLSFVKLDWLEHSIHQGTKWLLENQNGDGTFRWKKSGLNFALYLTATPALAIPAYRNYSGDDKRAERMISKCLNMIERQLIGNVLLRWERGSLKSIIKGITSAPHGGFIGDYPFSYKILRSLHRIYREIARSKISNNITNSSLIANRSVGYSAFLSTVESSTNYPDLYMTTEAIEALSFVLCSLESLDK